MQLPDPLQPVATEDQPPRPQAQAPPILMRKAQTSAEVSIPVSLRNLATLALAWVVAVVGCAVWSRGWGRSQRDCRPCGAVVWVVVVVEGRSIRNQRRLRCPCGRSGARARASLE